MLLCLGALALATAGAAGAAIPQSARYDVRLQGNVNGIPFDRTGVLAIGPTTTAATTNGVNPVDLCLGSGSPFITPETGAIWFATNGICVNANGARQDMAFVAVDAAASTIAIRPDPAISATGINGFNQSSGLTAGVWQIFEGAIGLQFQGNGQTITGAIDVLGTGAIFHSEQRYTATLTGTATALTQAPVPGSGTTPAPTADLGGATGKPPAVAFRKRRQTVRRKRLATIASLSCPAQRCTITVSKTAKLRLAGTTYEVAVRAPRAIGAGKRGKVQVKLPKTAFRELAGHTATVRLKITIAAPGGSTSDSATVTLKRR